MMVLEKIDLRALGEKSRGGGALSREEARAVLNWPENRICWIWWLKPIGCGAGILAEKSK
jgi:hypothetical protein